MKKIYFKPETEVIKIAIQQLIATSPGASVYPDADPVSPGSLEAPYLEGDDW